MVEICEFPKCVREKEKMRFQSKNEPQKYWRFCEKHHYTFYDVAFLLRNKSFGELIGKKLGIKQLKILNKICEDEVGEVLEKNRNRERSCRTCENFVRIERWGAAFKQQGICSAREDQKHPYLTSSVATSCPFYEWSIDASRKERFDDAWNTLVEYYAEKMPNVIEMLFSGKLADGISPREAMLGNLGDHSVSKMIMRHKELMDKEIEEIKLHKRIQFEKPDGEK